MPQNTYKLTWRNEHRSRTLGRSTTLGHVFIDHPNDATEICIKCQHPHTTDFLPLYFLLPSLGDLYDRLRVAGPSEDPAP